jgi:hypothetical protein
VLFKKSISDSNNTSVACWRSCAFSQDGADPHKADLRWVTLLDAARTAEMKQALADAGTWRKLGDSRQQLEDLLPAAFTLGLEGHDPLMEPDHGIAIRTSGGPAGGAGFGL